jgi:hypothetical protein
MAVDRPNTSGSNTSSSIESCPLYQVAPSTTNLAQPSSLKKAHNTQTLEAQAPTAYNRVAHFVQLQEHRCDPPVVASLTNVSPTALWRSCSAIP